ncbi:phospholipid/cholesterol/gamma-HCH transport system permease protein [Fodinibius salinus]|uniref:Phospholipid/cholesterol/gamma-HCH transport system permease protein n=1 Tax=Fodinibius salinus TaxID=860790 RepID=A0A5D3YKB1_9BACT|nr:ABC transporter permease [Fodinibius salinus]TYP93938.1 phospholipid/cholesterol/gamma-HCH transport system permease protein [Fodinibius salinus]
MTTTLKFNTFQPYFRLIPFMKALEKLGKYSLLLYRSLRSLYEFNTYKKNLVNELLKIGYESVPIVLLTGVFTGAVMTIQTAYQLNIAFVPISVIGSITSESLLIELSAVITSLVLAGKVGARIATELGTMRVSEQIDALESMGFNSVSFLVLPRVLSGLIMFPLLYIFASVSGILGGLAAAYFSGALPPAEFMQGAREFFFPWDVTFGMLKAFVFGYVITSISCFKGYYATGGAEGVGNSTTQATVLSCIYVLLADFVLASVFL